MLQLVERGIVLRPAGRYRSYLIHPYFAGYTSVEAMHEAIALAVEAMRAGELPEPSPPTPERHLTVVRSKRPA